MLPGTCTCPSLASGQQPPKLPASTAEEWRLMKVSSVVTGVSETRLPNQDPGPSLHPCSDYSVNQPPSSVFLCYPTHALQGQRHMSSLQSGSSEGRPASLPLRQPNFLPVWAELYTQGCSSGRPVEGTKVTTQPEGGPWRACLG